jgi:putative ABC transport system permease protein
MDRLLHDLRYAARSLSRQRSFTILAVLTLALGIGANAAIFSAVDAVLLRPLAYPHPDRIVSVSTDWRTSGTHGTVSAPDFHDWHDRSRSFAAMAYYFGGETSVSVDGVADYATAAVVTPEFFRVFAVEPRIGRVFGERTSEGGELPAVISHEFWMRKFGGRSDVVGRTVIGFGQVFTIVGVMPPGFAFPDGNEVWYPSYARVETTSRSAQNYWVVAHLADDASLRQAQAELTSIATDLERAYPLSNAGKSAAVTPLQEELVGGTRSTLYLLFGAVGVVLLIACANVANLLLVRATGRTSELAVRAALGASRRRLVAQLVTESVLIAVGSAIVGVVLARWGVAVFVASAPAGLPRVAEIGIDLRVLAFAFAAAVACSVLFGIVPALQASRVDLNASLRQGGRGLAGGRGDRVRQTLVVVEIACAVALVAGASLLVRSFVALERVDLGFNPLGVLAVRTAAPARDADEARVIARTFADLMPQLAALPAVTSVAASAAGAGGLYHPNGRYWLDGGPGPEVAGVNLPNALFTVVTPDYFRTLGIRLTAGRDFSARDTSDGRPVAIVSEALAKRSFAGGDPIGRQIECGLDPESMRFMTIVGVVSDVRSLAPNRAPTPELYMPLAQHPRSTGAVTIVARTAGEPLALANAVVQTIRTRAPSVPTRASTLNARIADTVATPRFRMLLVGAFALLALALAMAGVYGVMAYAVSRRTAEIGVRIAMGAAGSDILRLVLSQGLRLAVIGIVAGSAVAFALARWLREMLFGIAPSDSVVFAVVPLVLLATAAAATAIPALRAARVDPIAALRSE